MRVIDFGFYTSKDGRRYLLSWDADTGWLDLGGDHVAHIRSEERVRNVLVGWESHLDQPNNINWLVSRLDAVR